MGKQGKGLTFHCLLKLFGHVVHGPAEEGEG
jgi:hypothetical protein